MNALRHTVWIAVSTFCALLSSRAQAQSSLFYSYENTEGTVVFTDEPPEVPYRVQVHHMSIQESVRRALHRVSRSELRQIIREYATEFDVNPALAEAVMKAESSYDSTAISRKGARGPMQLMPATADWLGVRNIDDPRENIRGGVKYLRRLLDNYSGDITKATAAYNAGENAVNRHNGVPPYRETVDYVRKVREYYDTFHELELRSASRDAITPARFAP